MADYGPRSGKTIYNSCALVMAEYLRRPTCQKDIATRTGISRTAISRVSLAMRDVGILHVVGLDKDAYGRQIVPVYMAGYGKDIDLPYGLRYMTDRKTYKKTAMQERAERSPKRLKKAVREAAKSRGVVSHSLEL